MYTYEINFKNGKMLAGANVYIEDEKVILVNYMREKITYNKEDIQNVIEKRFFMGEVQGKVLFENVETNNDQSNNTKEIIVKYTKSISNAVEKELKKLVNKNIIPVFDLWETVEQEGNHIVKLMLSSKKLRNIQVIKEFPSVLDTINKQVTLYID